LTAELNNQGSIVVGNSSSNTWSINKAGANHVNSGTLSLIGGSLAVSGAGSFTNSGIVSINGPTLTLSGVPLTNTGALSGTGTIAADVANAGQVSPGGPFAAGSLSINGNYSQSANAVLNVDVGGTTAGTEFDQLKVSGAAKLDGTLNLGLINAFTPIS